MQLVENGRKEYDLGNTREVCILVDRVGSGKKNQDIGLLRELLPILQTHYPQTVGAIYIAPINMVVRVPLHLNSLLPMCPSTRHRKDDQKAGLVRDLLPRAADTLPSDCRCFDTVCDRQDCSDALSFSSSSSSGS